MTELPFPFYLKGEVGAKYEHSNKKKHLIVEFRSDEHEVCKPFTVPNKEHWWSKQCIWVIHYRSEGEPDIRKLN